ncbi:MAG: hypothetical protein IT304_07275 [Dehalococcoidia bacterium]|nr:hypothetical protein [Dehalococcoidia bacterium]
MAPAAKPIEPSSQPPRRDTWVDEPLEAREWVVDTATGRVVRRTCRIVTPPAAAPPAETP